MDMNMELGIERIALRDKNLNMTPPTTSSLPSPKVAAQESYSVITPRSTPKKTITINEDEPLIDTTETLQLKSKKTSRAQKKHAKRLQKTTAKSELKSFLDLPTELLDLVLSYLLPSDLISLQRLSHATRSYILHNEPLLANSILSRRYHVLSLAFPCPIPFSTLNPTTQTTLLSTPWQDLSSTHRTSYTQIIRPLDPHKICSCTTCTLAWANLNILLDLAHFQPHLEDREPIPMIPRGSTPPKWHTDLQAHNAHIVTKAMTSPLYYALILQLHLSTIVSTLTRPTRRSSSAVIKNKNKQATATAAAQSKQRLYNISPTDVSSGTDEFLERSGPPALSIPYHRDLYYNLEAYVPNRGWSKERGRWLYPVNPHESDLKWIAERFGPERRAGV